MLLRTHKVLCTLVMSPPGRQVCEHPDQVIAVMVFSLIHQSRFQAVPAFMCWQQVSRPPLEEFRVQPPQL